MSTLFFNTRYKVMNSISDFSNCIDYYNRDDRADKNLLSQNSLDEAEDMFSYYFYRKGSCGCFDFNGDKSYEDIMEEYQQYKPNYVWRSIISFTKEDAVEFGLKDKKDFAALTKKVVIKMAQEKGISLRDVAWGGFYHVNTEHPHVHFYFFNKRDPLDSSLFSKRSIEKIRATIGREIIDRSLLLKSKEDASRDLIVDLRNIINDSLFIEELKKYRTYRVSSCDDFIHPKIHLRKEVFQQFYHLSEILPRSGRLSYNSYALSEFRDEVDKMIDLLLNQKDLKEDYRIFKNQLEEAYHSNESLYGESERQQDYIDDQTHRLYATLGNAILKMIKTYRDQLESNPSLRFENYLKDSDVKKEKISLCKPYGYDLVRYSFGRMRHEISLLKQLQRVRERSQRMMLREIEKERDDNEEQEKGVEYGSS